jgi:surfeit locus 1 family protein
VTAPARRKPRAALAGALIALAALFVALGVWQVERRAWKHALIAAVDSRSHAAPVAAPGPDRWPAITADSDAYRRVTVTGSYLPGHATLVRAVSDLGSGYWVLAPLKTDGFTVLVNRGFVTPGQRAAVAAREPAGRITITGLLRVSEPGGGFLRSNDPAQNRWYSRDVAAIAAARGLGAVAPYFIDADAGHNAPGAPVGGLTIIRFADNHAVYALTWFAMAALSAWGAWYVLRREAPAP